MPFPSFVQALSTVPSAGVITTETDELLPASSTGFSSQSTLSVTRSSSSVLSIGNGSSASAPQYIRFNPKSRAITTATTLTIASGTGTGYVLIYGVLNSSAALVFDVYDTSGCTFTGGTGVTIHAQPGTQPYNPNSILLWAWSITSGAFDSTNAGVAFTSGAIGNQQTATDSWVDAIEVANITGSAVTLLIEDGLGTPIQLFPTVSIPANTVVSYLHPGGRFFDLGIFFTAGTASALHVNVRLCRAVRHPQNP